VIGSCDTSLRDLALAGVEGPSFQIHTCGLTKLMSGRTSLILANAGCPAGGTETSSYPEEVIHNTYAAQLSFLGASLARVTGATSDNAKSCRSTAIADCHGPSDNRLAIVQIVRFFLKAASANVLAESGAPRQAGLVKRATATENRRLGWQLDFFAGKPS
jgi:hypothetical protein